MKFFYFSLLFSAFAIIQIQCGVIQDNSDDGDDDDSNVIIIVPTFALTVIQSIIDIVTSTGISVINGLYNGESKIEEYLHDLEKTAVDYLWEIVSTKLKEVEPDSSDFMKAAIQCIEEQGEYLKATVLDFASQSLTCEVQKTVMTLNTFIPVLTDISNSNEVMKSLTKELVKCGTDAAALPCVNEIEDQIYNELSRRRKS